MRASRPFPAARSMSPTAARSRLPCGRRPRKHGWTRPAFRCWRCCRKCSSGAAGSRSPRCLPGGGGRPRSAPATRPKSARLPGSPSRTSPIRRIVSASGSRRARRDRRSGSPGCWSGASRPCWWTGCSHWAAGKFPGTPAEPRTCRPRCCSRRAAAWGPFPELALRRLAARPVASARVPWPGRPAAWVPAGAAVGLGDRRLSGCRKARPGQPGWPYTVGQVPGDLLDLILIVLVVAFAIAGYRQGFIIGILSFAGFIGGGAVGAVFGPHVARSLVDGVAQQALVAIIVVFIAAMIGQLLASGLGVAMRSRLTWRPATVVDAVGGLAVSVISVLLIAWLIASAVAYAPFPLISRQVNDSAVLRGV